MTGNAKAREVLDRLRADLAGEKRLGGRFRADRLELDADGVLIFEAEVGELAQKKIALETAAALPEIAAIVDRVRVKPAAPMGDAEIRAHLRRVYTQDAALAGLNISEIRGKASTTVAEIADPHGSIDYEVVDGIVTLNGSVPGLATKRYAGVLAWWIPGSRDVINGIAVEPGEADGADQIAEAVRLTLEKDPYLDASEIKVGVRNRTVRLTGLLPGEAQKRMAENDAWCVFGVDDVVNEIQVGS
jgi:osmotically-inducible protein OsmY